MCLTAGIHMRRGERQQVGSSLYFIGTEWCYIGILNTIEF